MPLDEDSSYLTTFNTPFGRYRFTVVLFGVTFAQEVFHRTVHEQFRDLPGCETDIDDILIWGRTIEQHDRNLERVLNRVSEINMTLGRDKCQFRQTEITYLGETLTQTGVKPDSNKIKAILQYTRPTSKHDLQRLLGMTNFIAKFLPKLSEVTAPLRELIKKNNEFDWLETHEQAFVTLKNLIVQSETLRYYDVSKAVILQVDAICIVVLYSRVCLPWHGFSIRLSRVLHASVPTIIIFCSVRCVDTVVNVILSRLWISCQTLTLPLLTLASRLSATRPSPPPTRSKRSRWNSNSSDFFLPFLRQIRYLPLSLWMFADFLSGKIKAGKRRCIIPPAHILVFMVSSPASVPSAYHIRQLIP